MTNKTDEHQDLKLGFPGVEIKISQGRVRGKRSAFIEIEVGGTRVILEAKPTPEDLDGGDLVVNVVKVAVVESNSPSMCEILGDPRIGVVLDKDGVHEVRS